MPTQQTDTIRVLPVGQPYNRAADPNKDQRFKNCYVETVANPFSQTKKQWLIKRHGFEEYEDILTGATPMPDLPIPVTGVTCALLPLFSETTWDENNTGTLWDTDGFIGDGTDGNPDILSVDNIIMPESTFRLTVSVIANQIPPP